MMKRYIISAAITLFVSMMVSCGTTNNTEGQSSDTDTVISAGNEQPTVDDSEENYTFKSTEELLANKYNVAMNGYVVIIDEEDIPEYMRDILIPYKDEELRLNGYKTLYGEVKIEPQFGIVTEFADNKLALAQPVGEGLRPAAINSKGELLTDPETMSVCWVSDELIKYHDISPEGNYETHIVDTDLNEYDISSYYKAYPAADTLDLTAEHLGNDLEWDGTGTNGISYGKYQNGFLPYSTNEEYATVSGLLDENGNIAAEYYGYERISSVAYGYYIVYNEHGRGNIYTSEHELVAENLEFEYYDSRLTEKMIYPGGYTYAFFYTVKGVEPLVIKIDPNVHEK